MTSSSHDADGLAQFIASFNADLADLNSPARVAIPLSGTPEDMLELQDDDGNFLDFIPLGTEPQMAAIAYRLYGHAFNLGVRLGENAAWAKLRFLIGAAAAEGGQAGQGGAHHG